VLRKDGDKRKQAKHNAILEVLLWPETETGQNYFFSFHNILGLKSSQ
jgi:hypothetical protein